MPLKITIVSAGSLPIPACKGGGVETLIQYFIDENEKKKEFDITLYTVTGAETLHGRYKKTSFISIKRNYFGDRLVLYGINRRILKNFYLRITDSYERTVIKLLKEDKNDIIIFENNLPILSAIQCGKQKYIFHAHYDDVNLSIREFDKTRYCHYYKNIDANIAVSSFINQRIQSVIGNQVDYYTVHNGIDYAQFTLGISEKEKNEIKDRYGIPDNKIIVMYSGRITEEKGVGQLIEALKRTHSNVCLVVVGGAFYCDNSETAFMSELKKQAKSSKNPIIFTGYVAHDKMQEMWAVSDIAVVPTYGVEEAAGLVVIEAMAAGKPVIISDSGAMEEYVSPECSIVVKRDADFICKLANAIDLLCEDKKLRHVMGENALIQAKNLDKEYYYKNMSIVIKEIAKEK